MIDRSLRRKWPTLLVLSLAELLGMSVYFSAAAVVPALTTAWSLDDAGRAWLTMSVQAGFVFGALGSALLNLSDLIPARPLFTISIFLAALSNALIPFLASSLPVALVFRFLTGMFLVGVYPVGMKIMATWTQKDRGLGIGLLVGALTVGTAAPHLLNAFSRGGRLEDCYVLGFCSCSGRRVVFVGLGSRRPISIAVAKVQLEIHRRDFPGSSARHGEPGLLGAHVGVIRHVGLDSDLSGGCA